MNSRCIMLQGTGSSVGKSLLTAALCRILKEDGWSVAPFKSQNMALNSYITAEGHEMGRAQVAQAEACGIMPSSLMNPILLKPTSDSKAQVIIRGKVYKNMSAVEYHEFKPALKEMIRNVYNELESVYDLIVIEGAGSPAEINLRENDLVNMGMAELADAPVILVGDIDKGGVFASIYGTIMLLAENERKRVKGIIINKFRGDAEILKPGIKMLEELVGIPVIGVVPYLDINLEDEDSVTEEFEKHNFSGLEDLEISVIRTPHISNFTDFNVLRNFPDVRLRYVNSSDPVGNPDMIILPGSKNTMGDLKYLREKGLDQQIIEHAKKGKLIMGICGGYQMLGRKLHDPHLTEGNDTLMEGLGLLDMETTFDTEKVTTQARAVITGEAGSLMRGLKGQALEGYEIHMGQSGFGAKAVPLIQIVEKLGEKVCITDGITNRAGNVLGTYLHGILDNTDFTRKLLNNLRAKKGLEALPEIPPSFKEHKEKEYQRLAEAVRNSLDMAFISGVLGNVPDKRR